MSDQSNGNAGQGSRPRSLFPRLLLLIPYIALLWVPFYNGTEPPLFGFPFFYWYQLLWVPITSLLIFIAYKGSE